MKSELTLVIAVAMLGGQCAVAGVVTSAGPRGLSPCPQEPQLQNWSPSTFTPIPNFIPGEQAGAVLDAPAKDYPIEILRIEIDWASTFGGAPAQIEQAIHIYPSGLPNPGTPQFTLAGPTLNDGVTNVFDISGSTGNRIINSGPFTVTLEFLNQSSGNPFAPSVVADGDANGCQSGKNAVFSVPGGWADACPLGVPGDWVFSVVYRRVSCDCNSNGVFDDDDITSGTSLDCNTNSVPDACDLVDGDSADCNTTGVPDECELSGNDCNTSGVPDSCESDFDADGVIDDCDTDIDDDGVDNGADVCDFTPSNLPANLVESDGSVLGDIDGDCDVDLFDYTLMQERFTGPNPIP